MQEDVDIEALVPLREEEVLDNPIWHSLTTDHAKIALGADVGHGWARRYAADVGPLAAVQEPSKEAYEDLARLFAAEEFAVLFLGGEAPRGWSLLRGAELVQMVSRAVPGASPLAGYIAPLGREDIPEMLALAKLAEPGPFRERTASLGDFVGIRVEGRLAAMAGKRLAPTGFREVSAVCTHPDFRGRGYAGALVTEVARSIHEEGRNPFLTSLAANAGALRIYEERGFSIRREFRLAVVRPPAR